MEATEEILVHKCTEVASESNPVPNNRHYGNFLPSRAYPFDAFVLMKFYPRNQT